MKPPPLARQSIKPDEIFRGEPGWRGDGKQLFAPLNSRAIIASRCATGYQNPDTRSCVNPAGVHWIEGSGLPNASTVGRNTLLISGTNNFDLRLSKSFSSTVYSGPAKKACPRRRHRVSRIAISRTAAYVARGCK